MEKFNYSFTVGGPFSPVSITCKSYSMAWYSAYYSCEAGFFSRYELHFLSCARCIIYKSTLWDCEPYIWSINEHIMLVRKLWVIKRNCRKSENAGKISWLGKLEMKLQMIWLFQKSVSGLASGSALLKGWFHKEWNFHRQQNGELSTIYYQIFNVYIQISFYGQYLTSYAVRIYILCGYFWHQEKNC